MTRVVCPDAQAAQALADYLNGEGYAATALWPDGVPVVLAQCARPVVEGAPHWLWDHFTALNA